MKITAKFHNYIHIYYEKFVAVNEISITAKFSLGM